MASICGSSYPSCQETTNFARICRIVTDVLRDILWQVLIHEIPPADLPNKVQTTQYKLKNLDVKIKTWLLGISPSFPEIPIAEMFDVSSLYTLIRNLCCHVPAPSTQWGQNPPPGGTTLGDDIERVREFKNTLVGCATTAKIKTKDFNKLWINIRNVVRRFDVYFSFNCKAMKCDFAREIICILTCSMDKSLQDAYMKKEKEIKMRSDDLEKAKQQVVNVKQDIEDIKQKVWVLEQEVDKANQEVGSVNQILQNDVDVVKKDIDQIKETLQKLDVQEKGNIFRQDERKDTLHPADKDHITPDVLVSGERTQLVIEMGSTWREQEFGNEDHLLQQQEMETRESSGSEMDKDDEGQDNADEPITQEHINHARLCNAMTTVCADALREILVNQVPVPYVNIYQAILAKQDYLTSKRLNNDQIYVVFPDLLERFTGTVDQFDISLLYTIIRCVSVVPVPATGWGNPPTDQPREVTLGASVERIRLFRNKISAHCVDGKISKTEFKDYWQSIEAVLRDIETIIGDHGYQRDLDKRKNQVITPREAHEQRKKIRAYIKAVKEKIVSDLDALAEAADA